MRPLQSAWKLLFLYIPHLLGHQIPQLQLRICLESGCFSPPLGYHPWVPPWSHTWVIGCTSPLVSTPVPYTLPLTTSGMGLECRSLVTHSTPISLGEKQLTGFPLRPPLPPLCSDLPPTKRPCALEGLGAVPFTGCSSSFPLAAPSPPPRRNLPTWRNLPSVACPAAFGHCCPADITFCTPTFPAADVGLAL